MYLAVALLVTCLLSVVAAPFGGADEENQSMRALELSHGQIVPEQGLTEAGGEIDRNVVKVLDGFDDIRMRWEKRGPDFLNRPWGAMTEAAQARLSGVGWAGTRVFAGFGNTAVYPPFLYAPASLGWRIGEAAGFTVVHALRLARLLCAVCAVLVGWLALRVERAGRLPRFAILLLPSVLFVNATSSQDALLVPVAALAAALLVRAGELDCPHKTWLLPALAGLLALLAMARPPYLCFAVLLFLPRWMSGEGRIPRWLGPLLAAGCVVIAVVLWRHAVAQFGVDTADEADPALQLTFLHAHPFRAAAAVLRGTAVAGADLLLRGLYVLGWNDLVAPWPLRLAAVASVLFASFAGAVRNGRRVWWLVPLACGGAVLGVSAAEYFIWTPPGGATVFGVLPRYWLPVLPFAALLWRGQSTGRWTVYAGATLSVALACSVPFLAARMFYLEGLLQVLRFNLR